jgi:hypothetical protein
MMKISREFTVDSIIKKIVDPRTILVFNLVGLFLQAAAAVEEYRRLSRRVGFYPRRDE